MMQVLQAKVTCWDFTFSSGKPWGCVKHGNGIIWPFFFFQKTTLAALKGEWWQRDLEHSVEIQERGGGDLDQGKAWRWRLAIELEMRFVQEERPEPTDRINFGVLRLTPQFLT